MTQKEMIQSLAELTGLSKYRLNKVFNELTKLILVRLKSGDTISLAGIGKLLVVDTKSRDCINPQTLEKIRTKPNKRIKFKVSSILKKLIRV